MRKNYKYLLLILCAAMTSSVTKAQETLSEIRNKYSISYQFGIAYEKETRNLTKNSQTIQLSKSFALNKLVSIAPVISYNNLNAGKQQKLKSTSINAGVDLTLYPKYLADVLLGIPYQVNKKELSFNLNLQKTLNRSDFMLVENININIPAFHISNKIQLSPTLGFQYFISQKDELPNLGYYTIGTKFLL